MTNSDSVNVFLHSNDNKQLVGSLNIVDNNITFEYDVEFIKTSL